MSVIEIRKGQQALPPAGCVVLHSVPTLPDGADVSMLAPLRAHASRVVYLSTTGVYGNVVDVDDQTPVSPSTAQASARVRTENAVLEGPWTALVLRPAAIYGPGRGVHVAMREGRFRLWQDGSNYVSRIHVDDLARIVERAMLSDLTGSYPVADAHPCPSIEIATFCAGLLGFPVPSSGETDDLPESRRANRRVDGSAICRLLGIQLEYPSYREGIRAALE